MARSFQPNRDPAKPNQYSALLDSARSLSEAVDRRNLLKKPGKVTISGWHQLYHDADDASRVGAWLELIDLCRFAPLADFG